MISKNWQDLSKPNKLEVKVGDDPKRQATVVARPLERGKTAALVYDQHHIFTENLNALVSALEPYNIIPAKGVDVGFNPYSCLALPIVACNLRYGQTLKVRPLSKLS